MKVPKKVQKFWNTMYEHGDMERIIHAEKMSRPTVAAALNKGEASLINIKKIQSFFNRKVKKAEEIFNQVL